MKRLVILLAMLPGIAGAWERPVKRSQVPAAVLETVERLYPGARQVAYDQDPGTECKLAYGVHILVAGRHLEINVYPNGDVRDVEETLFPREYPKEMLDAFRASKYADYKIERINRITITARPEIEFEFLVSKGPRRDYTWELTFDAKGKLIREYRLNPPTKDDTCVV